MGPVVWQATLWPATEFLTVTKQEHNNLVKGIINGCTDADPFSIQYEIEVTPEWKVSSFHIRRDGLQPTALKLTSDLNGHWFDKDGNHIEAFDDCTDIDISLTPFTNTLPIRRLTFEQGERKLLQMLYIKLPEFELQKLSQYYTKMEDRLYLYENGDSGFRAELPIDENGIVKDYPGLFTRIY
ncbi:putative glycolipid-binding domain-containing protein [Chitinophaga oryzae]|uniref:Glycolipid-binding domain-containing protein n=1 Tax=Chitinophaga oryzae TaxID=2725414 RepID=A0AAE6ZE69_9BACT|nr:putative glycolipid-binding domain-containing protein [Chitinophaga oryzae]QJB31284.1 putative glycolipid-binding domain-containing protein [Chitinophaga oryzae]QJB37771.1 putative glycolipid-binding domain-containing protein [Chitinophaga oryzae]